MTKQSAMTKQSGGHCSFPRQYRLLTAADYQQVFKNPNRVSTPELLFLFCKNNQGYSRLGMAVAKKKIPLAVDRNRVKRLIRESFRELRTQLSSIDIVVLARNNLINMDNNQIRRQLNKLWEQVNRKGKGL